MIAGARIMHRTRHVGSRECAGRGVRIGLRRPRRSGPERLQQQQSHHNTKIVEELPQMIREAVQLARQAVSARRYAYVLVYNRAEGNALLTVQALTEMLRDWVIVLIVQSTRGRGSWRRGRRDSTSSLAL